MKLYILNEWLLFEGQNEDRAIAYLSKGLSPEQKRKYAAKNYNPFEDFINSLKQITEPYINDPAGQNHKHLYALTKFFVDDKFSLNMIKPYYDRFMRNNRIKNKPIDNMSFEEFSGMVDKTLTRTTKSDSKNVSGEAVYEDENVKIYLGDGKEKCIKYGQGRKHGLCISRPDASNLYNRYRFEGATFYFVYFKNEEAKNENAPEDFIVIHSYPDKYMINYVEPNDDLSTGKNQIIRQFPALEEPFSKGVFEVKGLSEREKAIRNVELQPSIHTLQTADEKMLFIEIGKKVKDDEWKELEKHNIKEYIKAYIEVGEHDLPDEILEKLPEKVQKRHDQRALVKFVEKCDELQESIEEGDQELIECPDVRVKSFEQAIKHLDDDINPSAAISGRDYIDGLLSVPGDVPNFDVWSYEVSFSNFLKACANTGVDYIEFLNLKHLNNYSYDGIGEVLLEVLLENNVEFENVPKEVIKMAMDSDPGNTKHILKSHNVEIDLSQFEEGE
jgi:hypothetical protein